MNVVVAVLLASLLPALPAAAAPGTAAFVNAAVIGAPIARAWSAAPPAIDPLAIDWGTRAFAAARPPLVRADARAAAAAGQAHRGRPVVYVYSHGYDVRNRIHHDASYVMLPLFGAEAFLGERLYTYPARAGTLRAWHNGVAISIYSLFAVNTVTGAWNLWEGRKDPNGRTLRFVHGLLMLAADSLFVATAASTPSSRTLTGLKNFENQKRGHLDLAVASISTAMTGYVIMLFRH